MYQVYIVIKIIFQIACQNNKLKKNENKIILKLL